LLCALTNINSHTCISAATGFTGNVLNIPHKELHLQKLLYITTILSVVLYGCETWSLTLEVEHRLRVSENRVLNEGGRSGRRVEKTA
jgi:hypothetical protein